ncbi:outer membrane protein assembly factor BamD [Sphingomonas pituitosa]|uniref:outer membrane protein assembly factor BamD n=1 Tax=Sphingomonas pituitosa TaxID=99597 RepID=UPI00082B44B2|nr:outer membrane protein assembly factor BamD [Sphingomonas pituitosa]
MRIALAAALAFAAFGFNGTAMAQAQDGNVGQRVDKLEREMRAVQRKVFPGGAGMTVEPQITQQVDTTPPGVPATTPLADLTQRVAALESQIQTMTGQIEQNQYRVRQLEEAFGAYKAATDARMKALETPQPVADAMPTDGAVAASGDSAAAPARPSGDRAAKVAAVEKPSTGDAGEDLYLYGFRLWQAKLYPEAAKTLEQYKAKYPTGKRASFARNLLGRAYLDDNRANLAAIALYENYTKDPNGERAADSLYYLAQALVKLKKPAGEVCKVYEELNSVYGATLSAEMKAGVAKGRADQRCK